MNRYDETQATIDVEALRRYDPAGRIALFEFSHDLRLRVGDTFEYEFEGSVYTLDVIDFPRRWHNGLRRTIWIEVRLLQIDGRWIVDPCPDYPTLPFTEVR